MILFIRFGDQDLLFGGIDQRTAIWFKSAPVQDPFPPLDRAMEKFGRQRPSAVVCALAEGRGTPFRASWSAVRSAVAMTNGLAFAWGVPAAPVFISGSESLEELADKIRQVAAVAKLRTWIKATYSGEPNITKPKGKG